MPLHTTHRYVLVARFLIAFHIGLLGQCLLHSSSHSGNTWCQSDEDSEQPRIQLQTDFMAAHIPHSIPLSPGFYSIHAPNSNSQQSVYLSALLYMLRSQDLILFDPFWVGPLCLSSLIPPDFPLHIDSIRAEFFSRDYRRRDMTSSYRGNLIDLLDIFRKSIISAHGGDMKQVPTTLSITRVSTNLGRNITQFGVSAPLTNKKKSQSQSQMADLVRGYRVGQCWGRQKPPRESAVWKHGHCAENQSLSSVVAECAKLGLEKNLIIETLAMNNKTGRLVGMCGNCQAYVSRCILHKHPTWKVIDRYDTYTT